jgi:hypothetical protein
MLECPYIPFPQPVSLWSYRWAYVGSLLNSEWKVVHISSCVLEAVCSQCPREDSWCPGRDMKMGLLNVRCQYFRLLLRRMCSKYYMQILKYIHGLQYDSLIPHCQYYKQVHKFVYSQFDAQESSHLFTQSYRHGRQQGTITDSSGAVYMVSSLGNNVESIQAV